MERRGIIPFIRTLGLFAFLPFTSWGEHDKLLLRARFLDLTGTKGMAALKFLVFAAVLPNASFGLFSKT